MSSKIINQSPKGKMANEGAFLSSRSSVGRTTARLAMGSGKWNREWDGIWG